MKLPQKAKISVERARNKKRLIADILDRKQMGHEHHTLVHQALRKHFNHQDKVIKRVKKKVSRERRRGFETVLKPHGLRTKLSGVSLAQDKNGFFVHTHRARSSSYPSPSRIPLSRIRFIRSTG